MKKIIFTCMLGLLFVIPSAAQINSDAFKQTEDRILTFYRNWTTATNSQSFNSLADSYLTKDMATTWRRISSETGIDPFLQMPNNTKTAIKSLHCKHVSGLWYEVSFSDATARNDDSSKCVLIRVNVQGTHARINYMPEYKRYLFANTNDATAEKYVPVRYLSETNELFLSGFDTDGKGTFYFAGGDPLTIVCFKGYKQQFRRKICDGHTTLGIFHLHGDSLYVVNNVNKTLYAVQKDGTGEITEHPWANDSTKDVKSYGSHDYKGKFKDYSVYWNHVYGYEQLALYDKHGKEINSIKFPMPREAPWSMVPLSVLASEIDVETHLTNPDFDILRGNRFYKIGFDGNLHQIIVMEIDLEKAF